MFCTHCGNQIPDGSKFCPLCGDAIGAAPANVGPAAAPNGGIGQAASNFVGDIANKFDEMAGGTGHVELKFSYFYDEVLKKHEVTALDETFACGSASTTPFLVNVSREWPHPWVYARVFAILAITFVGMWITSSLQANPNGWPGLMFVAALVAPFTIVVFFFETNVPRNISFARVLEIFLVGGAFSVALVDPLCTLLPGSGAGDLLPSMLTGLVEEVAKLALVAFFFTRTRGRNYVLTGLLIGAAVGAGFAVFETAGYIFSAGYLGNLATIIGSGFLDGSINDMLDYLISEYEQQGYALSSSDQVQLFYQIIYNYSMDSSLVLGMLEVAWARALLAVGGHVAWAAVEGAGLALCDDGTGFKVESLWNLTTIKFTLVSIILHGVWDMTIPILDDTALLGGYAKYILLIAAVWVVLFVLINRGVAQINELVSRIRASIGYIGS